MAIWFLLVVASSAYLAVRGWALWKRVRALFGELATAQQRLEALTPEDSARLAAAQQIRGAGDLAVFAGVDVARREREAAAQAFTRQRQARRLANRPAWARHVD